jgi:hypothetical protein
VQHRIFVLSPAHCGGKRASFLYNDRASFELAVKLRTPAGATIGETFSFLSGLYFRGKLAYAERFAKATHGLSGAWTITTNRGLLPVETGITIGELRAMGDCEIHLEEPRYREPLERTAEELARASGEAEVVLLGSVASDKYVEILASIFGERLRFPSEFAGRGDMSRGALMLKCVREGSELKYEALNEGAFRGVTARRGGPKTRPGLSDANIEHSTSNVQHPRQEEEASGNREEGEEGGSERRPYMTTVSISLPPFWNS